MAITQKVTAGSLINLTMGAWYRVRSARRRRQPGAVEAFGRWHESDKTFAENMCV
jgi:hypothetical protein